MMESECKVRGSQVGLIPPSPKHLLSLGSGGHRVAKPPASDSTFQMNEIRT